jgi:hypothetical protein
MSTTKQTTAARKNIKKAAAAAKKKRTIAFGLSEFIFRNQRARLLESRRVKSQNANEVTRVPLRSALLMLSTGESRSGPNL